MSSFQDSGFDFSIDSMDYDRKKFTKSLVGPLFILAVWVTVVTVIMIIDGTDRLWIYFSILIFFGLVLVSVLFNMTIIPWEQKMKNNLCNTMFSSIHDVIDDVSYT